MVDKYGTSQDPYCYKGTDILINNFDIRDKETLHNAEREFTTAALNDIEFLPPPYDLSYLQDLHRLLFLHIYSWAGEIRTIQRLRAALSPLTTFIRNDLEGKFRMDILTN